jgi:hypothetical protein
MRIVELMLIDSKSRVKREAVFAIESVVRQLMSKRRAQNQNFFRIFDACMIPNDAVTARSYGWIHRHNPHQFLLYHRLSASVLIA